MDAFLSMRFFQGKCRFPRFFFYFCFVKRRQVVSRRRKPAYGCPARFTLSLRIDIKNLYAMNKPILKKADDLRQLYINLNNVGALYREGEGGDFYIPLYERKLKELKTALAIDPYAPDCFYIYGQPGSGKSTALNYFADPALQADYEIILIKGRELFDLQDVDILDVLLMFALDLLALLKDKSLFQHTLDKIYRRYVEHEELILESEKKTVFKGAAEIRLGVTLAGLLKLFGMEAPATLKSEYHLEKNKRELCRKFFSVGKSDFLGLVNQMIGRYAEENGGRRILAVFDDLEKIVNPAQVHALFIENRNYLTELQCKKIIITPVSLALDVRFLHDVKECFLGLKIKEHTGCATSPARLGEDYRLLYDIAYQRVARRELYAPGVIEKAIWYSGGNIRQFIRLLGEACLHSYMYEGRTISTEDMDVAVSKLKKNMQPALMNNRRLLLLLKSVGERRSAATGDHEMLATALSSLFVFIYQNGNWWSSVNPLLEQSVRLYLEEE